MSSGRRASRFSCRTWLVLLQLIVLALLAASSALASALQDDMRAELQDTVNREGTLVFLAIYWLPESHDWFVASANDKTHWPIGSLQDFDDNLSPRQKRDIIDAVASGLARLTVDQRQGYFERLQRWLISYHQLDLMQQFDSIEMVEEAVISLPATRPVYNSIVASRAIDPSLATPQFIAETMASGETFETMHETINLVSSFSDVELMQYFRDLYDKLSQLSSPESGRR
jgi:hypothetical protein